MGDRDGARFRKQPDEMFLPPSWVKDRIRTGIMAQLRKCLFHKPEAQSSDPKNPH